MWLGGVTSPRKDAQLAPVKLQGNLHSATRIWQFIADLRGKGFDGSGLELALKSEACFPSPPSLQLSLVDLNPRAVNANTH